MNIFTITGTIISITCFPLGVFIILKSHQDVTRWLVALFTIAVGVWGLGCIFISLEQNIEQSLLLWRLTHIGVIMIPVFLLHFIISFLKKDKHGFLIISSYIFAIVLQLANVMGFFIKNVRYVFDQFYYDSPPTILYSVFSIYFVLAVLLVHYWLIKEFIVSEGVRKKQIQYVLLGVGLGFAGGTLSFLPVFSIDFYPVFNFMAALFPIFTAMGVLRYRLMDIKVFIKRNVFYFLICLLMLGFYFLAFYGFKLLERYSLGFKILVSKAAVANQAVGYSILASKLNLFVAIVIFVIALFVLKNNFKSKINQLFSFSTFLIGAWVLLNYFFQTTGEKFLLQTIYAISPLVILSIVLWVSFLSRGYFDKKFVIVSCLIFLISLVFCFLIFSSSNFIGTVFGYDNYQTGYIFNIFAVFVLLLFAAFIIYSFFEYRRAEDEKRYQMGLVLIGVIFTSIVAAVFSFILPILGVTYFNFLDSASSIVFVLLSIYSILGRRFLDIKIFIRKGFFYFLICLAIFGVYFAVLGVFRHVGSVSGVSSGDDFSLGSIKLWYFPVSALINALTSVVLGVFLLIKDRQSKIQRHFFYFCLSVALWAACYFIWQLSSTYEAALFWSRALMFGAIFIAPLYLHLIVVFVDAEKRLRRPLFLFYSVSAVGALLTLTPWFIASVGSKLFFNFWPTYGGLALPFIAFWFLQVAIALGLLFKKYLTAEGVEKKQTMVMLVGFTFGFLGGSINYLLGYNILIPPYTNVLVTLYVFFTAYAILRYRFLDISLFIRKWFFYLFLALVIVGIYTFSASILEVFSISSAVLQYGAAGLVAVLVSVFFFPRIERFFVENKLFFKDQYDHSDALRDIGSAISSTIDFGNLADKIFVVFKKIFQIDRAAFILYGSNGDGEKIVGLRSFGFTIDVGRTVEGSKENIFRFFAKNRELVLLQELPQRIVESALDGEEHNTLIRVMEFLRGVSAEIAMPIYYKNKLTAIVALGSKEKKEIYSSQDIQFLQTTTHQLAVALENIRSYQKIKNYSADLQRDVESATKELRELNQRQSRFLADIAHELQSPVAILKGNINLLESDGRSRQVVSSSAQSADRLSRLINNLLFLASSDFGKLKIKKENFDFGQMMAEVYGATQIFAEQKEVNYILQNIEDVKILADEEKLKSVLLNILSNAFKHVNEKGIVSIVVERCLEKIKVTIFNSGPGISAADLPHIFERFYRREDGGDKGKSGTGLGLSIAKTIVDEHGGLIQVSNKDGEGVEFVVEI